MSAGAPNENPRHDLSVYSNAKTSFYSNMQMSAARQNTQNMLSPPGQNRAKIESQGNNLNVTDHMFGANSQIVSGAQPR